MKLSEFFLMGAKAALVLLSLSAAHATTATPTVAKQAASGVVVKANPKVTTGKVEPKVTTGTIAGKGDENQFPTGTIPIPPKPKKEGLEAAGAVKAKTAQP